MSLSRAILIREPAHLLFDSARLYFQSDILIKPVVTSADITSVVHGTIDTRVTDRMFTISGTLAGAWKDLSVLYASMSLARGRSIFGDTDKPIVIHTESGKKLTFKAGAITKPPVIILGAGRTMFGAFEMTAVLGNNTDPATATNYVAHATEAYPGDSTFDPAELLTLPVTAAWGATPPWDSFHTVAGWTITPELSLSAEPIDGLGTVDMKVADIKVTATAIPAGITQAQLYAALSHGTALGARRSGNDLTLTAAGVWINLTDCVASDGNGAQGDAPVTGEVTWTARRKWSAGALQPLLAVGDEEPE